MNMFQFLTATTAAVSGETYKFFFEPVNFLRMLKYMGLGMLIIFVVIGIIILATLLINKIFAD